MSATRRKRIMHVALGVLAAMALYFGTYYACVSVQFRRVLTIKEPGVELAYAYYKVGDRNQAFAQSLFEPARLIDAYYVRRALWNDKVHPPTVQ
jgi:hypothetical protein